jgi:hypothetical protein
MDYGIDAASREDINWIARFEAEMYSVEDAVPEQILGDWYDQNPNGFWIIKHKGQPIGHLDILPVKPEILQNFIAGVIVERDIRGIDLYSPNQKALVKTLYVESIAISPSNGHNRALAVNHLLSNFFDLVSRIADPSELSDIYAIAATIAGRRFLGRLGFGVVKRARERKDQHDLFAAKLPDLGGRIRQRGTLTPSLHAL